jgi:hypothetical protein
MNNNKCQRGIALLCAFGYLLMSCTALEGVTIPGTATPRALVTAQVGDKVVVTTKAGEKKTFRVTAVEPDALVGKNVRIAYADMSTLSIKQVRAGKTALVVVAVVLAIAIVGTIHAGHVVNDVLTDVLTP